MEIRYHRPTLYPLQQEALFNPARYAVCEAGTKSGKTVGAIVWILEQALAGKPGNNYWWVAPRYTTTKIAFRRLMAFLPLGSYEANRTELTVTLANQTVIWFKSADDPDGLYGEDVWAAVLDEASRMKEDAWVAIRSTVTATQGPIRIIGNVKGSRNWAWKLARRAEQSDNPALYHYSKITVWDAVEAGVFPLSEALDARQQMTGAQFQELYEAEASDDHDLYFIPERLQYVEGVPEHARQVRGWDFAVSEHGDYTAGVRVAEADGLYYITDIAWLRAAPDAVVDAFRTAAAGDGYSTTQLVEEEKGSAGALSIPHWQRAVADLDTQIRVEGSRVDSNKVARAFPFVQLVNENRVHLVEGDWQQAFIEELEDWPHGAHDDQVDAAAHAVNWLLNSRQYMVGSARTPGYV